MADFWIKVEKSTPDKPEILQISSILNISDPDTVMGKLIRVWSWFDSNSENGHAPSVTNVLLDRMTGVTGFTDALVTVGWMEKTDDGFYMSNFDRHIGKGAKKRASDAERKRKSRETSQECHKESVTEKGLDKSRVDKIKDSSQESKIPPCPHEKIIDLYHKRLPELQGVNKTLWKGSKREKDLLSRWKQDPEFRKGEFWDWYFRQVRTSGFHMGENDRVWRADLGWLIKKDNFIKLVEKFSD